jgi:hypothetical protein
MGEIFIGTEAVADGIVTRHELARWYRPIYPNVRIPRGSVPTLGDRTTGAWLWTKRQGLVTDLRVIPKLERLGWIILRVIKEDRRHEVIQGAWDAMVSRGWRPK